MVLEKLIESKYSRKNPLIIFIFGLIVSFIALFISYTVFKESTGLFTIVIITLTVVPFMADVLRREVVETEMTGEKQNFFQRHGDVIMAYVAIFCGMVLAMSITFVILPQDVVEKIFSEQIREINIIQGKFTFESEFLKIVSNNMSVLLLTFLLSFLIGAGSILIIAWNASVLAAAIGLIAQSFGGVKGIPIAVLTFIPHGSFELVAYFIGAIAGGMISVASTRKRSTKFSYIFIDSLKLLMISFILLIIGGAIETMIIIT